MSQRAREGAASPERDVFEGCERSGNRSTIHMTGFLGIVPSHSLPLDAVSWTCCQTKEWQRFHNIVVYMTGMFSARGGRGGTTHRLLTTHHSRLMSDMSPASIAPAPRQLQSQRDGGGTGI
uniref:Uncharacterized protein n=1 Tax=Knipowitschia caucasica TaxID=637954 RepID=A0AAV2KQB8_KNICA